MNSKPYQNMLTRFSENPFLTIDISSNLENFNNKLKDVFILINRYYPSFTFYESGEKEFIKWEDKILNNKFVFKVGDKLEFNIPVLYMEEGKVKESCINRNGLAFYFDIDHSNEEVLILFVRPNSFTNKNYVEFYSAEKGWEKKIVDQTLAAKANRKNLENFLSQLEKMLEGEIKDYGASNVSRKFIYKYGFKEDAVLNDLPS